MARRPMPDVIVLLPGITGSVLEKDRKEVWAPTGGAILDGLLSLGKNVKALALEDDSPDAPDLGDGVVATKIMPDIHLLPGLWKIDGYSKALDWIETRFDVRRGENLIPFPYDWRRDNRASAHKLARESAGWLRAWRERSGNADAKLNLVGHSMGGLISRYFVECLEGWRDTRLLVTFGTPYRGSLKAIGTLANGFEQKIGPLSIDLTDLVRSFTSVYQLLPIYPCYEDGAGGLARVTEVDIPHVDRPKATAARAFHDEIIGAVEANLRDDAYSRSRYGIRPVAGTLQPTAQSARASGDGVELLRSYEGEDQGGDGTVPRVSATPVELEHEEGAMFASEQHASLQNDDAVLFHLAGILTGLDLDLGSFRALPALGIGLDVEDAFAADEPIRVRARPEEETAAALEVVVEDATRPAGAAPDGELKRLALRPVDDGWYEAELGPLAPGEYRLTVLGSAALDPVSDVFIVFPTGDN
jgi:hypothetical protein